MHQEASHVIAHLLDSTGGLLDFLFRGLATIAKLHRAGGTARSS
jgi:hypothetical protein